MRIVWFMPLAYVAGIDGFSWFVPYLALVGTIAGIVRLIKKIPRRAGGDAIGAAGDLLELEPTAA